MILYLRRLSLKNKIMILSIAPLIVIFILMANTILNTLTDNDKIQYAKKLFNVDMKIANLLVETQKERGMSAGFLGSKGTKFVEEIKAQRLETNKQLSKLREFIKSLKLEDSETQTLNEILKRFSSLEDTRSKVNNLNITLGDTVDYYTNLNEEMLTFIANSAKKGYKQNIISEITAYYNLLQVQERAGLERAVGTNVLAKGSFGNGLYEKFLNLISMQNDNYKAFELYGHNYVQHAQEILNNNSIVKEIDSMRNKLLSSYEKHILIGDIKYAIGYDGIIHHFKNYVLRKDVKYKSRFIEEYNKLNTAVAEYNNLKNLTEKEKQYLLTIENTFKEYYENLSIVDNFISS